MAVDALDRRESDFRTVALLQFRAQRGGDDLMPEAHAEQRLADAHRGARQLRLDLQSGILVGVEGTHRPAHDHHAGDVFEFRQIRLLLLRYVHHLVRKAQIVQAVQNASRLLPRNVLQNQHLRLLHAPIVTHSRKRRSPFRQKR